MMTRPLRAGFLAVVLTACGAELPGPAEPTTPHARPEPGAPGLGEASAPGREEQKSASSPAAVPSGASPATALGAASPAAPIVDVATRLAAWKSCLQTGLQFEAEKTVPGFGYAFANNRSESAAKAVIVSPRGETEGPWTERSSEWGHEPATAMVDAGDLNGDGEGDLLMTWGVDGGESGAIYLSSATGPVEAWKTGGRSICYSASLNGKSVVYVEIPAPDPNDGSTYQVVTWNGKGFAAAAVPSIPNTRRPARATAPFSGECSGNDDHVTGPMGGSWFVRSKVRNGKLVSFVVVGNQVQCSGGAEPDLEIGKEKTMRIAWSLPSMSDKPPREKHGNLKVRVQDHQLHLRGRLCGDGAIPEVDTVVPCSWIGPDQIAGR